MAFKIQDLLISDLSTEVACTRVSLFRCTVYTYPPCDYSHFLVAQEQASFATVIVERRC